MKRASLQLLVLVALLFAPALVQHITILGGVYWIGFAGKIFTHIVLPVAFVMWFHRLRLWPALLAPLRIERHKLPSGLLTGAWLGGLGLAVLFGAYGFFGPWLNLPGIVEHLDADFSVNRLTYPLIALGIVLTTPFLEEYFWRGWVYRTAALLANTTRQQQAALWLTGLAFAIHHVVIFAEWFNWWQLLLATTFLGGVGVLFNFMYHRWNSIIPGLVTHVVADIAIVTIGFHILFS